MLHHAFFQGENNRKKNMDKFQYLFITIDIKLMKVGKLWNISKGQIQKSYIYVQFVVFKIIHVSKLLFCDVWISYLLTYRYRSFEIIIFSLIVI